MQSGIDLTNIAQNIVYVKPVATTDLPQEVQEQVGDQETLYAVHDANGEQLALVADERMAFVLARQNDMAPVQIQ